MHDQFWDDMPGQRISIKRSIFYSKLQKEAARMKRALHIPDVFSTQFTIVLTVRMVTKTFKFPHNKGSAIESEDF